MNATPVARIGGLRLLRIVVLGNIIAVAVLAALLAVAFTSIQRSREASVRTSCRETNDRNETTRRTLDQLYRLRAREASPARRRQMRQGRDSTIALIDALAPRRDCEQRVRQLLHP